MLRFKGNRKDEVGDGHWSIEDLCGVWVVALITIPTSFTWCLYEAAKFVL